ncbi:MAG: EAL domain-containing protein [Acidimicrobiia bacterium]|nr:EAL domain-containing protein [Acidimicrobiia bacterium]
MPTLGGGKADAQKGTRPSSHARPSVLRLPKPLLERVRWTFLQFSLISGCLLMVAVLARHDSSVAVKAVGIVALAGLSWLWVEEYRLPLSARWDLVEGAALVAVGVAVGNPLYMLLLLYGRLSFRSFSSSIRQAVTAGIIFFAAFFAPVLILPSSGGEFSLQLVFLASGFPLCVAIMNTLHQTLDRLERSVEREQVLREAGAALVAATDRADIYVPSVRAALDLLGADAATAAMVAVVDKNGALRTVAAGPDGQVRGTDVNRALPEGTSERLRQGAPFALTGASASALVATLGFPSEAAVAVIPFLLRRAIGGAIFVALSGPLPEESVTSLQAVGTQLGLAIDRANLTDELHERRSEERFRSLVQSSWDVIAVVDVDSTVRYVSPSLTRTLGYDPSQLIGRMLSEIIHPDDRAGSDQARMETLTLGRPTVSECRVKHRDESWRHMELTRTNLLHDENVGGIVVNLRDVTDRRKLEEELRHQAFHDPLTSLANRALFQDRTGHALARADRQGEPVAVLFLDLDEFKMVNDSLGHLAGDQLLQVVSERILSCIRPGDTAARFGGDEFAVLLEDTKVEEASAIAARLLDALKQSITVQRRELYVTASIGIAPAGEGRTDAAELLRDADVAMYAAKAEGKARYSVYRPSMHEAVVARVEVTADLQRAVDRQELVVHYQPIVDLATGQTVAVEALVRWDHPTRGMVPPLEFVPIAEETGLIEPIGRWVLHQAVRDMAAWRQRHPGLPLYAHVNVSANQLHCVLDDTRRALAIPGADPSLLVLEITESVMVQNTDVVVSCLEDLKALGVRLSLDDFGTGYSSLSYLRRLPIDLLKIDKAFVHGIAGNAEESSLGRAVVHIAKTLDLETAAEGIETAEELAALRSLGCRLGQGFLFSRPVLLAELERLLCVSAGNGEPAAATLR